MSLEAGAVDRTFLDLTGAPVADCDQPVPSISNPDVAETRLFQTG